jgi:hypothetical protein
VTKVIRPTFSTKTKKTDALFIFTDYRRLWNSILTTTSGSDGSDESRAMAKTKQIEERHHHDP